MVLENAATVLEGIAWCLAEYVKMPVGQRIVGTGLLLVFSLLAYNFVSKDARTRARVLQAIVAVLSATSMAISLTMGHSMPEMEFLFLWLPLAGWLSVAALYLLNKQIQFAAFKPIAFPNKLRDKTLSLALELGVVGPIEVGVFDSGKIEVLSSAGSTKTILVSLGALEALSHKELEAVLFHELVHLKHDDSLYKMVCTAGLFTVFAPLALAAKRISAAHQETYASSIARAAYPRHFNSASRTFERFCES